MEYIKDAWFEGDREKYDEWALKGEDKRRKEVEARTHCRRPTGARCVANENGAILAAMYPNEWCEGRDTAACRQVQGKIPKGPGHLIEHRDRGTLGGKRKRRTRKPKKHNKKSKKYHKKRSYKKTYRKH